jgi:hypothetical protein
MRTATPRRTGVGGLDYYLLRAEADDAEAAGLVIEEFVLGDDLSATRLRSACWMPAAGGWSSSATFARALRADPRLRARLAAVDRAGAERVHRRLGGGALPGEEALRQHFRDDVPLASGAPLRLGVGPDIHRVLFAGEPDARQLARLSQLLRLAGADGPDVTRFGVVGTGRLRVNDTDLRWDLRRVGGVAWCVDVVSESADDVTLRWALRQLIDAARRNGLVPVTVERLR